MRFGRLVLFTVAVFLAVSYPTVRGQSDLVLYDDFNGKFIDPDKWVGQDFVVGQLALREQIREIKGNALRLASRLYSEDFRRSAGSRVRFTNPAVVNTIEAELRVTEVEVAGCPAPDAPSTVRATVQGFFFNDGSGSPATRFQPENRTGEFSAAIRLFRSSDSVDPPGVFQVIASAFRCDNAECSAQTSLGNESLGTIASHRKTTVRVEWNAANSWFLFQRDADAPVPIGYSVGTIVPPMVESKFIDVVNFVPNCGGGFRPLAYLEVFVDNVRVNP